MKKFMTLEALAQEDEHCDGCGAQHKSTHDCPECGVPVCPECSAGAGAMCFECEEGDETDD